MNKKLKINMTDQKQKIEQGGKVKREPHQLGWEVHHPIIIL